MKPLIHKQFGKGQDIIFLHGWGGNKDSLLGLANSLSNEFRVTLVDFYGHGEMGEPPSPLTLADYVGGLVDLINHYKMSHVILVGHSFGGRVAILAAARYGHLFDRLVLLGSAGLKPKRKPKYYFKVFVAKLCKIFNIQKKSLGSDDYIGLSPVMKRTFVNIVNYHLDKFLKYITTLCIIIYGENDKDTPIYMAKRLHKGISNSKLVIVKNAGHYCFLEKKFETLAAIKRFLGV